MLVLASNDTNIITNSASDGGNDDYKVYMLQIQIQMLVTPKSTKIIEIARW